MAVALALAISGELSIFFLIVVQMLKSMALLLDKQDRADEKLQDLQDSQKALEKEVKEIGSRESSNPEVAKATLKAQDLRTESCLMCPV